MVRSVRGNGPRMPRRPTVAVGYEDVTNGYKCADWFALHGYQATMTSAVHHLEHNLKELRPDVIVVRLSSASTPLQSPLSSLKETCPQVPIIAMVDRTADRWSESFPDLAKAFGTDVFLCDSLDPPAPLA